MRLQTVFTFSFFLLCILSSKTYLKHKNGCRSRPGEPLTAGRGCGEDWLRGPRTRAAGKGRGWEFHTDSRRGRQTWETGSQNFLRAQWQLVPTALMAQDQEGEGVPCLLVPTRGCPASPHQPPLPPCPSPWFLLYQLSAPHNQPITACPGLSLSVLHN